MQRLLALSAEWGTQPAGLRSLLNEKDTIIGRYNLIFEVGHFVKMKGKQEFYLLMQKYYRIAFNVLVNKI